MMNLIKAVFGNGKNSQITDVIAQGGVIIDVRSPGEFATGHAFGAINIPLDQLEAKMSQIKSYKKPLVLCCASGVRSARAKALLTGQEIAGLYDAGSWQTLR